MHQGVRRDSSRREAFSPCEMVVSGRLARTLAEFHVPLAPLQTARHRERYLLRRVAAWEPVPRPSALTIFVRRCPVFQRLRVVGAGQCALSVTLPTARLVAWAVATAYGWSAGASMLGSGRVEMAGHDGGRVCFLLLEGTQAPSALGTGVASLLYSRLPFRFHLSSPILRCA